MQISYFKLPFLVSIFLLCACQQEKKETDQKQAQQQIDEQKIPFLTMQEQSAKYALPFCEKKDCIDIDIQTIYTQDQWLNQWIEKQQSRVIQAQIDLKQNLSLQQAVDAYTKKSDTWQQEFKGNHAYQLTLNTRIASQRNQYVLLQLALNAQQADIELKDRQYFMVADRRQKKQLSILEMIKPEQQQLLDKTVQEHYALWIKQQPQEVQERAPKKLYWGQADWFFDGEGIGFHYRTNEITPNGKQLDIYLNRVQTQQFIQESIFKSMFT